MPIAFKEWAVTVRALAEGEQLITLRKGGIREPGKPLPACPRALLPVPHVRPPAGRSRARVPPARAAPRARGGRLERRRAAAARVRVRRARAAARPRAHPRLGRGRRPLHDRRPALRGRALPLLRVDARLRRKAPGLAPAPAAARAAAAHLPHPPSGDRQGQGRVHRLPRLGRAAARASLRGHPRALRRRVRARLRGDPRDHQRSTGAGQPVLA